jgi:hypothetical protein
MVKSNYPHNCLRKSLNEEEKKRFNSYKKRECERRRRYVNNQKKDHKNFNLHRCEICRKFYEWVQFLYGFSICEQCPSNFLRVKKFLQHKTKATIEIESTMEIETKLLRPPKLATGAHLLPPDEASAALFLEGEIDSLVLEFERAVLEDEFQSRYPLPPLFDYDAYAWENRPLPYFSFKRG